MIVLYENRNKRFVNDYDTETVTVDRYQEKKLFSSWFVKPISCNSGFFENKSGKLYSYYLIERKGFYKFFYRLKYIKWYGIGFYFRTFIVSKNLAWDLQCFGLIGTINNFFYFSTWQLRIFLKDFFFKNIYCPLFFCPIQTSVKNLIKKIKNPYCMNSDFRMVVCFVLWKTGVIKFVSFILRRKIEVSYHSDYIHIMSDKYEKRISK